ncbi:unnamed protein product (macronuclear) [Paramecium tetraurelia]|uniref:Uncharacterized protein n=1 Tax=Paramecium tetraurelia TaxID=5888 RepID=A0DR64_PARTE|nr:uncharacterized protein GSPATT00019248001 [Paramecium tetraurelia]CAK85531.1 unnamed protein product [Paramecium tetraurelia]|eukprot:XP_001452928.1 hypothetical protein (macronuclear) [Paramecium tetraurelia strain d4-2]
MGDNEGEKFLHGKNQPKIVICIIYTYIAINSQVFAFYEGKYSLGKKLLGGILKQRKIQQFLAVDFVTSKVEIPEDYLKQNQFEFKENMNKQEKLELGIQNKMMSCQFNNQIFIITFNIGDCYDEQNLKNGLWIDLDDKFSKQPNKNVIDISHHQVIHRGQQKMEGKQVNGIFLD